MCMSGPVVVATVDLFALCGMVWLSGGVAVDAWNSSQRMYAQSTLMVFFPMLSPSSCPFLAFPFGVLAVV